HSPPSTATATLTLHDALPIFRVSLFTTTRCCALLTGRSAWKVAGGYMATPCNATISSRRIRAGDTTGCTRNAGQIIWPGFCRACLISEEHTSELQSRFDLVCRFLFDNKNIFTL